MRISTRIAAIVLAATVGLMPAIASAQPQWLPPGAGGPRGGGPGPGVHRAPQQHDFRGGPARGGPRDYRGGRSHRGNGGYYRGYERDDGWDPGAAAAAGIIGLAVGAMAVGAASGSSGDDHTDRCANRYRSYDPSNDSYRGYDGRLHRCRL